MATDMLNTRTKNISLVFFNDSEVIFPLILNAFVKSISRVWCWLEIRASRHSGTPRTPGSSQHPLTCICYLLLFSVLVKIILISLSQFWHGSPPSTITTSSHQIQSYTRPLNRMSSTNQHQISCNSFADFYGSNV